jgi:uncharacterized protein (DUF1800 family)
MTPASTRGGNLVTRRVHSGVVAAGAAALLLIAAQPGVATRGIPEDAGAIDHALSRLTFGSRPTDAARVREIGLARWIELQLNPSRIDDREAERRLPAAVAPPETFDSQKAVQQFSRQSVQRLASARLMRAVYSDRQLQEILVDFWFNHFNVFAGKGRTSEFIEAYETETIRPHVFGHFRDLLEATAKSPAMLFYLDNWLSADPDAAPAIANGNRTRRRIGRLPATAPAPQAQNRRRGLNENYGRELLELHTLGVDGGYTQQDIIEVARAFTGWTIERARASRDRGRAPNGAPPAMALAGGGEFRFAPALHDARKKVVLGHTIDAGGGIEDGERVLDILAAHPSTAHHIATKLVQRFVSDSPPEALVRLVADRFRDTKGDLRETVRAVITSDEFFAQEFRRAKVKTPLEFVVSAVRASGRDVPDARPMMRSLQQLGMPLYMCQPPTGYEDTAEAWISAGALVTRMNVAQMLTGPQAERIGGPEFQRR